MPRRSLIEITGVRGLEDAGPGHITFLANPKYGPKLKTTQASAVIAAQAVDGIPTLISANPYHDFARALELVLSAAAAEARRSSLGCHRGNGAHRRRSFDRPVRGRGRTTSSSAATPCCIRMW